MSATELARQIRRGTRSPVDVVDQYLERITDSERETNAYVTLLADQARSEARKASQAIENNEELGLLHGVPVALKDLYAFKRGVPNTFGSQPFADFIPETSAPLVQRLEDAGGIVLGKTNTPEFGHRGTTINDVAGRTANPFDNDRTVGGSSGGSAAAVADGLTALAQGSDHAGSIRIPASACGVYGFFPSVGRVPQAFVPDAFQYTNPYVGSGPMTRYVDDAALMLDVMSGPHPHEPHSLPSSELEYRSVTDQPIDDYTIAYTCDLDTVPVSSSVRAIFDEAVDVFSAAGADVVSAAPSPSKSWEEIHSSLMTGLYVLYAELAELFESTYGIDLLAHRDQVSPNVIHRIERGKEINAVEYKLANISRTDLYRCLQEFFREYDALVLPTLTIPPFEDETGVPDTVAGEDIDPQHGWFLTWPFNLTGNPAASIPAGFTDDGLPVGLQIVGPRFADDVVLAISAAFERERPWQDAYPPSR